MLRIQKHIRRFYFRRKKPILATYRQWLKDQSLSLENIEKKQLNKLNKILTHAYLNVPYYNTIFESSPYLIDNKIILNSLQQLSGLPVLAREIVKNQFQQITSKDHLTRKSFVNFSGGSTGIPTEVLQDEAYLIANEACLLQLKSWRGVGPFDSEIFIWGAERDTFEGKKPLSSYIGDFLRNRIILNCFRMDENDIRRYIKIINKHNPQMLRSYVDAAYEIARFSRTNDIKIQPQKLVHTGAGNLYDYMRTEIEEAFGCKVFDQYGGREFGSIASECSAHDGLHILSENCIVEILDQNGQNCQPGHEGEIVVTNLHNYSMPMIRYKVGDIGIIKEYSPCACGCNYTKLDRVSGRVTDSFITANGRKISSSFFIHLIGVVCNDDSIDRFQVIQKDFNSIIIKIIKNRDIDQSILEDIKHKIQFNMGQECTVEFQFVDEIEKTPTGKYRYTISEIKT